MAGSERRDWRELCAAAATETDSEKVVSLVNAIIEAFDERERGVSLPTLPPGEGAAGRDDSQLQATGQNQHEQDDNHQTQAAARVISPAGAVRPRWQRADQKQNQDDEQNG